MDNILANCVVISHGQPQPNLLKPFLEMDLGKLSRAVLIAFFFTTMM